jgi:hypothetical protein
MLHSLLVKNRIYVDQLRDQTASKIPASGADTPDKKIFYCIIAYLANLPISCLAYTKTDQIYNKVQTRTPPGATRFKYMSVHTTLGTNLFFLTDNLKSVLVLQY